MILCEPDVKLNQTTQDRIGNMAKTELFMNLIKHRLCPVQTEALNSSALSSDTVQELMSLAQKHDLIAIIGSELLEENLTASDLQKINIEEMVCQAACFYEIMNHEIQWLCSILEDGKVPHIVLKGGAIRGYYPEPWLRTSGDIDILVPEEMVQTAISLLLEKGCTLDSPRRYHDVPLRTPGNNLLELHFHIREDIPVLDSVLDSVWKYSNIVPDKRYQYQQSTEFLLFHLLAHMSYHLIHGGCGIRSFLDIWMLQQKQIWDSDILQELLQKAHLTDFYSSVVALLGVWFDGVPHNELTLSMQELIIDGGTFGSRKREILMEQAQAGSRSNYILGRIFMSRSLLQRQYPLLAQYPILLPCFQILRWVRILTRNRSTVLNEMKTSHSNSDAQIQKTQLTLKQIGLNF